MNKELVIIGLGPGDPLDLTPRAMQALVASECLVLRTAQHPVVDYLARTDIEFTTCDQFYEDGKHFEEVYQQISNYIFSLLKDYPAVSYAVPGHPLILEKTVQLLREKAAESDVGVQLVAGLSALDVIYAYLKCDPGQGIIPVDALDLPDRSIWAGKELLVTQVYSKLSAGDVKLSLLEVYPPEHPIKVLQAIGVADLEKVTEIPLYQLDWQEFDHLTSVYVPSLPVAKDNSLAKFIDVIATLRAPGGCPWDQEQTHQSLKENFLEETYEVLEAIEAEDPDMLCEELGDVLLQIVLHTQIAAEVEQFTMEDVLAGIIAKMVRRHPHVFGDHQADDKKAVLANWEQIKLAEKALRSPEAPSLLGNIPPILPALMQATKVQTKAARVGFDWDDIADVWAKVHEEIVELKEASAPEIEGELGDVLFATVNLARFLNVSSETALLKSIQKFRRRFNYIEQQVAKEGKEFSDFTLAELDVLWEEAKQNKL